jgi:succinoglycan biosynthesis transport protein ExoP
MLDRNSRQLAWQDPQGGALAARYDAPWAGYPNAEPVDEPFDPLKLFYLVLHYRWLIAAVLGMGLVLGLVVTLMQTPKYAASARVENHGAHRAYPRGHGCRRPEQRRTHL